MVAQPFFGHSITDVLGAISIFVHGGGSLNDPLPGVLEVAHIAVCFFLNETIFYFSHRFLSHQNDVSFNSQKTSTFSIVRPICSEYAHPIGSNFMNLIAMYAGLVLMGSHFLTWAIWVGLRIYETNDGHSGYEHIDSASRHAHPVYPHRGCYGTALGIWDRLLGTDRNWREWKVKVKVKKSG